MAKNDKAKAPKEYSEPEDQVTEGTDPDTEPQVPPGDEGYHDSFDPLAEPVKERGYTQARVTADERMVTEDIPEPTFEPPDLAAMDAAAAKSAQAQELDAEEGEPEQPKAPQRPFNPQMNELPKADQNRATEVAVDAVLDGYGQLKRLASSLAKIPKRKYERLVKEGKINPDQRIPYKQNPRTGEWVFCTIAQFRAAYDDDAKDTISLDSEFRDKVKPVMMRVFQKRGIGMTDEQYLLYLFGQDVAISGYSVLQMSKQANALMKNFQEYSISRSNAPSEPTQDADPEEPRHLSKDELEEEIKNIKVAGDEDFMDIKEEKQDTPKSSDVDSTVQSMHSSQEAPKFGETELVDHMKAVGVGEN